MEILEQNPIKADVLLNFGTDLTSLATAGKLDPMIGRQFELNQLIQVLCKRQKNNACLIGDPGVGKTAVVEGLATMIANGSAPKKLIGKKVFSIDMARIFAASPYNGMLEKNLLDLVDQVVQSNGMIILFIDELHTLMRAGDVLKPALARGELRCVGATTLDEYRKHIEKDKALKRRFQAIDVPEPSREEAIKILQGLQNKYETYHGVTYTRKALIAAVDLSKQYISDRFLPDKAIDLIDEAGARVQLRGGTIFMDESEQSVMQVANNKGPPTNGGQQGPPTPQTNGRKNGPPTDGRQQGPPAPPTNGRKKCPPTNGRQQGQGPPAPPTNGREKGPPTNRRQQGPPTPPTNGRKKGPPTNESQQAPPTDGKQQAPPTDRRQQGPPTNWRKKGPPTDGKQQGPPTPPTNGRKKGPPTNGRQKGPPTNMGQQGPPTNGRQQPPSGNGGNRSGERDKLRKGEAGARVELCEGTKHTVTEDDIQQVISMWTGIPLEKLTLEESHRLLALDKVFEQRIIGQDEAVSSICRAIRRARVGLRDMTQPVASFLFTGPTGVGKTELAKVLAEEYFGSKKAMVRLDMSEYSEPHTTSRLFGSPPGYVGFEEGGQLTEAVRRRPHSVVLFDEIEKADLRVFDAFLQILDDGRLTDGQGKVVDFTNAIVIFTSNIGGQLEGDYDEVRRGVGVELKGFFKPELLNRLDEIVVFRPLEMVHLTKIVDVMLRDFHRMAEKKGISVELGGGFKAKLVSEGYSSIYGARPLRRAITRLLEDPLAERILNGIVSEGQRVRVDVNSHGEVIFHS